MAGKSKGRWVSIPEVNRMKPSTAYEAESWLSELAIFLKDHKDYDLAKWFSEAVKRREETGHTLEHELGLLHSGPGAPAIKNRPRLDKERHRRMHIVSNTHPLVAAVPKGKKIPWKKIAAQIGFSGTSDELRKLYTDYYDECEVAAHQLVQEIGAKNK